MDSLDRNTNHINTIEFNKIVHDTMKKLNNVHNKTIAHNTSIHNSSRSISSSDSTHDNETKEDVQHSSEVNNNNVTGLIQNNAKDYNVYQNGSRTGVKTQKIQQNSTKTNGYVNGHSNHNRCTIVQNFQNYHKPNR